MKRPLAFEVTLEKVTASGDLVFCHNGDKQYLIADQGSIGSTPSTPASIDVWKALEGETGSLTMAWHATGKQPALFSFLPYKDPTLRRIYVLDDAGTNPFFIGWRNHAQPAGFLSQVAPRGRGA